MKKILLAGMFISSLTSNAQTTFHDGVFSFVVSSPTTVSLTKADAKDAEDVTITSYNVPEKVVYGDKEYNVNSIGEEAFKWNKMTSVTLPESIDSIYGSAFNTTSNLQSITLPSKLKYIGDNAFSSSAIKSIDIPASVEEIGSNAFFTCTSLSNITMHEGLKKIGTSIFYKCAMTSIDMPESLDSIPNAAFYNCSKLTSISFSSKLYYIGDRAFRETAISSINLPSTVKTIGEDCFLRCSNLTSFTVPAATTTLGVDFVANTAITTLNVDPANTNFCTIGNVIYSMDKRLLYAAPTKGLTEINVANECIGIWGGAFSGSDIKQVTLPEGFLAVDGFAFCESALESINFPSSLIFIGEQSFASTKLKNVRLPENMEDVNDASFAACTEMTSLTIPAATKLICNRAFYGNTNLNTIECLGSVAPVIDDVYDSWDSPFYNVNKNCTLIVPQGATSSYKSEGWNSYFTITEAQPTTFDYISTIPSNNGTITPGWTDMAFDIVFAEPITIQISSPKAKLHKGSVDGSVIDPDDEWYAIKGSDNNTLRIWGADYDGFMCIFKAEDAVDYYMVIPAGVVKNAAGLSNGEIVIKMECRIVDGIDNIDANNAEVKAISSYSIDGQIVNANHKGLTIMKMADGTVRKIFIK